MLTAAFQKIVYLNKYWRKGRLFLLNFLVSVSYNLICLNLFVDPNPSTAHVMG